MTSHPVAMLLPVMRNGTSKVWKKRGNRLRMHTWSVPVTWLPVPDKWLPVTSFLVRAVPGDITPGSSSSNATLAVPIYYKPINYPNKLILSYDECMTVVQHISYYFIHEMIMLIALYLTNSQLSELNFHYSKATSRRSRSFSILIQYLDS
jgi:hypothetical protein